MKKASKLSFIFGGVFGLLSILTVLSFSFLLWIGGAVPGLVLGIIDIGSDFPWIFLTIGLPIMGGLWILSGISLLGVIFPFICMVLSLIAGIKKKGSKALSIICMVLSIFAIFSGSTVQGILMLLGAIFFLSQPKEEPQVEVVEQ